jgi:hypothetical protein
VAALQLQGRAELSSSSSSISSRASAITGTPS